MCSLRSPLLENPPKQSDMGLKLAQMAERQLIAQLAIHPGDQKLIKNYADNCRRLGKLNEADRAYQTLNARKDPDDDSSLEALHRQSFWVLDEFLSPPFLKRLLDYVSKEEAQFQNSKIYSSPEYRPEKRLSKTLMINQIDAVLPRMSQTISRIGNAFTQNWKNVPFTPTKLEVQVTCYQNGHFFSRHLDPIESTGPARVLTGLLHFYYQPKRFRGGDLLLYDAGPIVHLGQYTRFSPINNRFILFPSQQFHEVLITQCDNTAFQTSRFVLVFWLWGDAKHIPEDHYL